MKTLLALLMLAPAISSAQIAAADGWAVNGTVTIQGKTPEFYDHTQAIAHEAQFDAYGESNVLTDWNSWLLNFGYSEISVSWSGPTNPVGAAAGTSLRDWTLRVDSQQRELLVLSLPYLGSYANVKGNCPGALESFTSLDVHDASLTINGQSVPIPAQPDEGSTIPLDLSNDLGNSSGRLVLRAATRNDSESEISVTALDLQVQISQGETNAVVNVQIGYGHAAVDCLSTPVELQSWVVE